MDEFSNTHNAVTTVVKTSLRPSALACSGVSLAACRHPARTARGSGWCRPTCSHRPPGGSVIPRAAHPRLAGQGDRGRPDGRTAGRGRMDPPRWSKRRLRPSHPKRYAWRYTPDRGRAGRGRRAVAGRAHPPAAAQCGDHLHGAFHARAHPAADRVVLVLPLDLPLGPDLGRRVAGHRSP